MIKDTLPTAKPTEDAEESIEAATDKSETEEDGDSTKK